MTVFWRLIGLCRPRWPWILAAIAVGVVATLANIGLMATSGWFITAMGLAGAVGGTMNYFTPAAIIRALAILRTGGRYVDRLVGHEATLRLLAELRVHIFRRLVPLVPGAVDDLRSGDLAARLGADIDRLELALLRIIAPTAVALASVAAVVLFVAYVAPALAGWIGGCLLVALVVPALAAAAGRSAADALTQRSAALRDQLVGDIEGLAPLLLTGAATAHAEALDARMTRMLAAETRAARIGVLGQIGITTAGDLTQVAVLLAALPLVASGALAGPELTLVLLAALATFEALAPLPEAFASFGATLTAARRVFALLDTRPIVTDPARPAAPNGFGLTLTDVSLTYPGGDRPALAPLSLTIPAGARLAIVGASGTGKSSLAELLVRFRDPSAGGIRLGGIDLRQLDRETLRRNILLVPQRPHIMTATLAENLRLGAPDAGDAALADALALAQLTAFVAALPQGLDTPLGRAGARISGGEARRVALARALLVDAPILILDEPTEGLDGDTERRLLDALFARTAGRTLIILTHRPATLGRVDSVIRLG
jgi:ATP-binding cassette subfamily C protein CydC